MNKKKLIAFLKKHLKECEEKHQTKEANQFRNILSDAYQLDEQQAKKDLEWYLNWKELREFVEKHNRLPEPMKSAPLHPDKYYPEWEGWRKFLGSDTCCDKCGKSSKTVLCKGCKKQ